MKTSRQPSEQSGLSICLLAGEASGDAQGALLARALRAEFERAGFRLSLWGSAGKLMKEAGVEPVVHIDELSAMGFGEVVAVYPRLSSAAHRLQSSLRLRKPDITILIDYPGLNMRLMEDAFHLGSCVVYHIPPKVWAHGAARAARLRDCTYLVTCILPFEEKLLRAAGINAKFIGNPLSDEVSHFLDHKKAHAQRHPHEADKSSSLIPCVGLVPGSRAGEIERVFPEMIKAFVKTKAAMGGALKAVVPVAPTVSQSRLEQILHSTLESEASLSIRVDIELVCKQPLIQVLHNCRYAWVCSGTAALEAALLGVPHSVVYKMHWLTYAIAKRIVRLPWISLENLCSERQIVPEFIQDGISARALSEHALSILQSAQNENLMRRELMEIANLFPKDSARHAAKAVLDCFLSLPSTSAQRFHSKAVRDLIAEDNAWGLNK
jgi:lipid-A-disaccharide synthase